MSEYLSLRERLLIPTLPVTLTKPLTSSKLGLFHLYSEDYNSHYKPCIKMLPNMATEVVLVTF